MLSQEYIINNSKYTHDYEAEAVASFEATGDDKMVAFYDYENFRGSNELLSA